jgi:hypothetical protein
MEQLSGGGEGEIGSPGTSSKACGGCAECEREDVPVVNDEKIDMTEGRPDSFSFSFTCVGCSLWVLDRIGETKVEGEGEWVSAVARDAVSSLSSSISTSGSDAAAKMRLM